MQPVMHERWERKVKVSPALEVFVKPSCWAQSSTRQLSQPARRLVLCLLVVAGLAAPCLADTPLPTYLTLPAQVQVKPNPTYEDFGEAAFKVDGKADQIERGRHWQLGMTFSGLPDGTDPDSIWARIRASLVQGGWTNLSDHGDLATLHQQKNGHDAWVSIDVFGADDIRMDFVEIAPPPITLALKPPAATPEQVSADSGDFPYLAPMPGSQAAGSQLDTDPMLVVTGKDGATEVAANSSIKKSYSAAAGLGSNALFATVYQAALTKAGWTITQLIEGPTGADASLTAHYTANGRNLWAYLHNDGGGQYLIQVADLGAEDIGQELDRDCHVALYGIEFDFNKATIRQDSDAVLNKVLALLNSRPDLKLEVQGHTDNVGGDAYNQKLSEARANAVVAWLSAKGVAAARLSAHGYGMTMPIADNGSDEGRAKNRRVEIKKQGCGN